jgi:hypothetical protein
MISSKAEAWALVLRYRVETWPTCNSIVGMHEHNLTHSQCRVNTETKPNAYKAYKRFSLVSRRAGNWAPAVVLAGAISCFVDAVWLVRGSRDRQALLVGVRLSITLRGGDGLSRAGRSACSGTPTNLVAPTVLV